MLGGLGQGWGGWMLLVIVIVAVVGAWLIVVWGCPFKIALDLFNMGRVCQDAEVGIKGHKHVKEGRVDTDGLDELFVSVQEQPKG